MVARMCHHGIDAQLCEFCANDRAIELIRIAAFEAGKAHGKRTDLPIGHSVHQYASDLYPSNTSLWEAFLRGWDSVHRPALMRRQAE